MAMIVTLVVMVAFALWRVNKTLRLTSADENEYRTRLRRSIYQFALWAGLGLAAVAGYGLLIAPTPMPYMWRYLLSFVGAYAVLLIICAGVYALVRRH
jgi:ABC-type Na+ efflux pump permease subunit